VAASGNVTTISGVDELCRELFLSHRARERDDNLLFVRDRLLYSEEDRARMLSLYGRVRNSRQKVADDETNPLVTRLWLSGVVKEQDGHLRVRNRIYARVFNTAWVAASMPDAELRRLRSVARQETKRRRQAEERERATRRHLYVAEMGLAHQALMTANVPRALELLARHRRSAGHEELRGFEWCYLWHEANRDDAEQTLSGHAWVVAGVAFSPDGGTLASTSWEGSLRLWDLHTGRAQLVLEGFSGPVSFSPNGNLLVGVARDARSITLRDPHTGEILERLEGHHDEVVGLAVSPDGQLLASASWDGTVKIWEIATRRLLATLEGEGFLDIIYSPAFSPDSKTLATSNADGAVRLWDLTTMRERERIEGFGEVSSVAYSPDGARLALSMAYTGNVVLWEVAGRRPTAILTYEGTRALRSPSLPMGPSSLPGARTARFGCGMQRPGSNKRFSQGTRGQLRRWPSPRMAGGSPREAGTIRSSCGVHRRRRVPSSGEHSRQPGGWRSPPVAADSQWREGRVPSASGIWRTLGNWGS